MDETNRLATLHRYAILDTANEVEFDVLARRIADLFAVPSVLISFIDGQRQWSSPTQCDARHTCSCGP